MPSKATKKLEHDKYFLREAKSLIDMLNYPRPSGFMNHPVYVEFLETFIEPMFGKPDEHGNYILIVMDESLDAGDNVAGYPDDVIVNNQFPRNAYMAHHDTVHNGPTLDKAPFKNRIMYVPTKSEAELVEEKKKSYAGKASHNYAPYISPAEKVRAVELFVAKPEKIKMRKITQFYHVNPDDDLDIKHDATLNEVKDIEVDDPNEANINCLGADCTAGVWLILEMIAAKVPGVYVIHAEEEVGRVGAEHIMRDHRAALVAKTHSPYYWIDLVDTAISFDRKGTDEIITHQSGRTRCASDKYADSLSELLSPLLIEGGYKKLNKSQNGSFTDSYSYKDNIPECINLCVGYTAQHSSNEKQDIKFLVNMRNTLIANGFVMNDPEGMIVIERDHTVPDRPYNYGVQNGYHNGYGATTGYKSPKQEAAGGSKKTNHDWDELDETNHKVVPISNAQKKTSNADSAQASEKTTATSSGGTTCSSLVTLAPKSTTSKQTTFPEVDEGWDYDPMSWGATTNPVSLFATLIGQGAIFTDDEMEEAIAILLNDYSAELASFFTQYGIGLDEMVEHLNTQ